MAAVRAIRHDVILILETVDLLGTTVRGRGTDPFLQLRLLVSRELRENRSGTPAV